MGELSFNTPAKALASSTMVRLQSHSVMVLSADIVLIMIYPRSPASAGSSSAGRFYKLTKTPG
jgi:hypothetical protein